MRLTAGRNWRTAGAQRPPANAASPAAGGQRRGHSRGCSGGVAGAACSRLGQPLRVEVGRRKAGLPPGPQPTEEVKVGVAGFWGQAGSPSLKQLVVRCHIKDSARPLGKAPFHISRRVKHRNSPMGGGETGGAQTLPPGHSQAFWVPEGSPETGCGSRSTCRATHDGTVPPGSLSSSPEARPRPRPVLWGGGGG